MPTPQYLQDKQAKKDKKKNDNKITAQKKFNEAKKKKSNDDKPKVNKKKIVKDKVDYRIVCYQSRWLDLCDVVFCDLCWAVAVDCHHNYGRIWKLYDDIFNLSLLCRECHNKITFGCMNTEDDKEKLKLLILNKIICPNTIQKK